MSANRASDFPSSWAKRAGAASETSGESWRRIFRDIGQIAEKRGKKRALCTLGVDGAVVAAISEPLMRGVFPGVGGMVAATAFKSPVRGCVWLLDLPA